MSANDTWKAETDRFVVFMDIMGFKDLVMRKSHEEVRYKLELMVSLNKSLENVLGKTADPKTKKKSDFPRIRTISFSDSVLLISQEDTADDFLKLMYATAIFQEASLQRGVPTKGAVSYGKFTADFSKSIFFGQPLIDAYLLQEELFYYGVIADNNVEAYIIDSIRSDQKSEIEFNGCLKRMPTLLKRGSVNHYNVRLDSVSPEQMQDLYKSVSGSVRKYVDNTVEMFEKLK